jgi:hypothetical protein
MLSEISHIQGLFKVTTSKLPLFKYKKSNFLVQISETLKKIVFREHYLRTMLFQTLSDIQNHFIT